jgi:hypothetical protein
MIDPFKRAFNSLFYPEKFDHRPNEKLSVPRALLTGFLLVVIGFDIGAVAAGSALGFKDFVKEQALATVHPIGMIIMMALFGLWVANSIISPFFGETFSRIGLFFREPIANHKYDLENELPFILKNSTFLTASNAADATAQSFSDEMEFRTKEVQAYSNAPPLLSAASHTKDDAATISARCSVTASNAHVLRPRDRISVDRTSAALTL